MLNPIKTQLTILQQEGYSTGRFLKWWITHPFTYFVSNKKPLVLTQKVRRLLAISYVLFGLLLLLSIVYKFLIVFPFSAILFLIEPFIFLFAAILIITPFERIHRRRTINRVRKEVLGNPDLTVIGIAGSFVGGFLASLITHQRVLDLHTSGFIGSVIGAIALLVLFGLGSGRRASA
mgnify:CR=1 FL=1